MHCFSSHHKLWQTIAFNFGCLIYLPFSFTSVFAPCSVRCQSVTSVKLQLSFRHHLTSLLESHVFSTNTRARHPHSNVQGRPLSSIVMCGLQAVAESLDKFVVPSHVESGEALSQRISWQARLKVPQLDRSFPVLMVNPFLSIFLCHLWNNPSTMAKPSHCTLLKSGKSEER